MEVQNSRFRVRSADLSLHFPWDVGLRGSGALDRAGRWRAKEQNPVFVKRFESLADILFLL